ncbi:MAG: 3'-5' exonuclease [Myxococcota bacterium]
MWGNAAGDVDSNTAMGWLWQTYAPQRLLQFEALPFPLMFVDIETTQNRIVEIATVRMSREQLPSIFHTYLNPGDVGWARSGGYWNTEHHGLTAAQVAQFPTFSMVVPALERQRSGAVIVGHNVSFEQRFLAEEYARTGSSFTSPDLCTLRLARTLFPHRREDGGSFKLDDLASMFDVRNPAPHRAIGDTVTTIWVLAAMLESRRNDPELSRLVRSAQRDAAGRPPNPWVA